MGVSANRNGQHPLRQLLSPVKIKMEVECSNSRPPGSDSLTGEEEAATEKFLENVNKWRAARELKQLSRSSALKFLMARKFNVDRALVLYQQHEIMRIREGLTYFDHSPGPLQAELSKGKFTILPSRDPNGATIALFNLHLHEPTDVTHQTVLQCVVFQLDVALEEIETQRNGLVFIYNMSNSKYANFDYDLSQKMLTLLKGCYPARLKKVLIVTAPLWFKAPFKVLRLFVREKLRDRVFTVSTPQLVTHVPLEALPPILGGNVEHDHTAWLKTCTEVTAQVKERERLQQQSTSAPTTPIREHPTIEQLESLPVLTNGSSSVQASSSVIIPAENEEHVETTTNGSHQDRFGQEINHVMSEEMSSDDEALEAANEVGMSLEEFIEHVRVKGRRGLHEEYAEIKARAPSGTFNHARSLENAAKNRYTDVLCYDHSRVILNPENNESGSDYINANYVDGYKQPKAFIFSQGPLPRTFVDIWQLVWEQQVMVIVMTTKTIERHRTKCGQYWPEDVGESLIIGENKFIVPM